MVERFGYSDPAACQGLEGRFNLCNSTVLPDFRFRFASPSTLLCQRTATQRPSTVLNGEDSLYCSERMSVWRAWVVRFDPFICGSFISSASYNPTEVYMSLTSGPNLNRREQSPTIYNMLRPWLISSLMLTRLRLSNTSLFRANSGSASQGFPWLLPLVSQRHFRPDVRGRINAVRKAHRLDCKFCILPAVVPGNYM